MPKRSVFAWLTLVGALVPLAGMDSPTRCQIDVAEATPDAELWPQPQYCYAPHVSLTQAQEIDETTGWLNPAAPQVSDRFALDAMAWTGEALLGGVAQAQPASLTFSFPSGFAPWGDPCCFQESNQLNALLEQTFGAGNLDQGREYLRQSLASWAIVSGISLREVADDDSALDFDPARSSDRGDIRIGANTQQSCTRRGATFLPVNGGDIFLNAGAFFTQQCTTGLDLPDLDFINLRNVTAHEMGHALGFFHSTPCDNTKLLEPSVDQFFEFAQTDDIRGVQRNYGDRLAPNHSSATAHDFGDLTSPTSRAIVEPNLSTNGSAGPLGTGEDWFAFAISAPSEITISATPKGGSYAAAQQTFACEPAFPPSVNAQEAGDLHIELWSGDASMMLAIEASAGPGAAETLVTNLDAGSYLVRIADTLTNDALNQFVQLYDLEIRPTGALAPPRAVAGLDKRVLVGRASFFIGDMLSSALEPGATLNDASFDWDLDGDQTFETLDDPRPMIFYPLVGVVPVTLRVTDSNGMSDEHTIEVTVVDAPPVPPGPFDLTSPATNSDLANTTPTLSWQVSPGAATYTLRIEVDGDDDGTFDSIFSQTTGIVGTSFPVPLGLLNYKLSYRWSACAINQFGMEPSASTRTFRTPQCTGDANYDKIVNFADITSVLNRWLFDYPPDRSGLGDSDGSGNVDFVDITNVLLNWTSTCP